MTTDFAPSPATGLRRRHAAQRGQTIVIALLVLLLLAFVGGLFATIVTRNLQNAGRSNRVQSADYYAEAGIRFANDQLTYSLDGADWRPPLQFKLADATAASNSSVDFRPTTGSRERLRYDAYVTANTGFVYAPKNDPDKAYLDQGFARYNIGGGRYLLRVSYDPAGLSNPDNASTTPGQAYAGTPYSDPRGRYIKIEAVGREGVVDSNDPTTYSNSPRTQLNATLVQYKAIGITDYSRFETNPDNRSDTMSLGVASTHDKNSGNLLTPGVYDFTASPGGPVSPLALTQFALTTSYGATDAYLTKGNQLIPNPTAGTQPAGIVANGYTTIVGGGSIRANGSVRFFGQNFIYLNNSNSATSGVYNDDVEIAGNLLLDNYQPGAVVNTELMTNQDAAVAVNPPTPSPPVAANYVAPSNGKFGFDTHNGQVRDSNGGNDSNGNPRSVNRLEPPTLDSVNPVTNLPRYKAIAMNATPRNTENTATNGTPTAYTPLDAAKYGYGQAIYVDNSSDVQRESSRIVGGYTLIDEWLHRNGANDTAGSKSGWLANFYRPPGVDIELGRQISNLVDSTGKPNTFYGVRLTRSDVDGGGNLIGWKDPTTGNTINGIGTDGNTQSTMTVSYKSLNASNDLTTAPAATDKAYQANPNNDVIIYAEGNVRVHGVVSADPGNGTAGTGDLGQQTTYAGGGSSGTATDDDHLPRHVTIVTNGTAYIDGNLLRGNPESTITVLAHDYVCVNTTQFLAGPTVDQNPSGTTPPGAYTDPSLRALDFSASDEELLQEFNFGLPSGSMPSSQYKNSKLALYISGSSSGAGSTSADFDILDPRNGQTGINAGGGSPPFLNPILGSPLQITTAGAIGGGTNLQTGSLFRTSVDLSALTTTPALSGLSQSNVLQLAIRRSQGNAPNVTGDTQDFLLERAAILPMDIRIEAVLFAQTRSFFVIPGEWFNTDPTDNTQAFVSNKNVQNANGKPSRPGMDTTDDRQNRFPFYGQPIDMKIIIDGAVSEARPADITSQTDWMLKWGWLPEYHGGLVNTVTPERAGHPVVDLIGDPVPDVGLQIIYDPLAGYPFYSDSANAAFVPHYLRSDIYGRPLPFAPKMPVATGLLYAGQNTGASVLQ